MSPMRATMAEGCRTQYGMYVDIQIGRNARNDSARGLPDLENSATEQHVLRYQKMDGSQRRQGAESTGSGRAENFRSFRSGLHMFNVTPVECRVYLWHLVCLMSR